MVKGFNYLKGKKLILITNLLRTLGMILVLAQPIWAADLKWEGYYRVEGVFLKNQTFDKSNSGLENSYFLHHFVLKPEIVPADRLKIRGRFDIFNNALGNNQAGQPLGGYSSSTSQTTPSAVTTHTQREETIVANELYLSWVGEFSALMVGRMPFHFGLGMVYNAGNGPYDHALSNKDMVAYKFDFNRLKVLTGYGKVRESALTGEDDINDYLVQVDFEDIESDLYMGFLFDNRVAPTDSNTPSRGNDFDPTDFAPTAALYDGFNAYNMNFFVKKKTENWRLGAELGFVNGYTGVKVNNGGNLERVELSGFGVAAEVNYKTGVWDFGLRAGLASGDDPDTTRFEGFFFSPNYDVGIMMFNHVMGAPGYDPLRSTLAGSRVAQNSTSTNVNELSGLDTEVISNALYISPNVKYAVSDDYDIIGNIVYGQLHKPPVPSSSGSVGTSLGFETDFGLVFHPTDKFIWTNQIGLLFPGNAWAGTSAQNFKTDFAYGFVSKAAITF